MIPDENFTDYGIYSLYVACITKRFGKEETIKKFEPIVSRCNQKCQDKNKAMGSALQEEKEDIFQSLIYDLSLILLYDLSLIF